MHKIIAKQISISEPDLRGFGPQCRPLFYTALLAPPTSLRWGRIPGGCCEVSLDRIYGDGKKACVWSNIVSSSEGTTGLLPRVDFQPGAHYAWRVQRLRGIPRAGTAAANSSAGGERNDILIDAHFWLLDAEARDHLKYGASLLERSADGDFALLAQAILLSESALFEDALRLVRQRTKGDQNSVHGLLTDTAQSVIYRQMERHLQEQSGLPDDFLTWVRNRELYYRSRVRGEMNRAQVSGGPARSAARPGRSTVVDNTAARRSNPQQNALATIAI